MKKFIIILGIVIGLVVFLNFLSSIVNETNDTSNSENVESSKSDDLSVNSLKKISIRGIEFECYYLDENFARIKSDTLVLDTSILNLVIEKIGIKVSPIYFHSKNLTETGEEYATAFNSKTTIVANPPRTKQDVIINSSVSNLLSKIGDCNIILNDKSITIESANSYIETLNEANNAYIRTKNMNSSKITDLKNTLKNKIISAQVYLYPKARKAYVKKLADKMWEENVDVTSSGTSITLVGGIFASNKNKQEAFDAIYPMLLKFRFKRANFKWIQHDDEYTYWNIDSPADKIIE